MHKISGKPVIKVSVVQGQEKTEYETSKNKTILALLQETGYDTIHAPCGGNGICGKCLVKVDDGHGLQDVRACQTQICSGMCIYPEQVPQMLVVQTGSCVQRPLDKKTGMTDAADELSECSDAMTDTEDEITGTANELPECSGGMTDTAAAMNDRMHGLAAACDIGTTTIVCHLLDGQSGQRLASVGAPNVQRAFGADVLSRIQASFDGKLGQMHDALIRQLNGMLTELCQKAGAGRDVAYMAIAGNTVMCHIAAGLAPDTIGTAPFAPLSLFGRELDGADMGLEQVDTVYMAPAVAGYVGGDITAGMLAAGLDRSESDPAAGREVLFIDIGTNGEIVLGRNGDYACCATAAGPAFEGAQITKGMPACNGAISKVWLEDKKIRVSVIGGGKAEGICGSGLVDAMAVFLETGLMDETGCLADRSETGQTNVLNPRVPEQYASYIGSYGTGPCIYLTDTVCITQADIRQLQMAKAAIAAGIQILLKERGTALEQVGLLALAGGFGSFLNLEHAAEIGLIPKELLPAAYAVGNAAGEGAVLAALSARAREKLSDIQKQLHYVELSVHPQFFDAYIHQMNF